MFDSIFGHFPAKRILGNMIKNGTVPNSFCFYGVDGIGKRAMARELAKGLFCQDHTACGVCPTCLKFQNGTLPDYVEIGPEGREIKVASIRNITEQIHYKPFETPYRIFLIDQAETMNEGAANAFLKSLEEPPSYIYFFLVTSDLDKILPTIRSRCQKLAFQPLTPVEKEQILVSSFQIEPGMAFNLAHISFRHLETQPEAWDLFKDNVSLILTFYKEMHDKGLALDFFGTRLRSKDELGPFLDHFLACMRELLFRTKNQVSNPVFKHWEEALVQLAGTLDTGALLGDMSEFMYRLRSQNRNLNWSYWFNQFSVNGLGLKHKYQTKHREWLLNKGIFQPGTLFESKN